MKPILGLLNPRIVAVLLPFCLRGAAAEAARDLVVDSMAATTYWQLGGRRVNYGLGESALSASNEQVRPGAESVLKLTYDFREPRRDYLSAYWTGRSIAGRCESLSFWLCGDSSGRPLSLAIEDAAGCWFQRQVGAVDWAGWQQVTVPVGDGQGWRALRRQGDTAGALRDPVRLPLGGPGVAPAVPGPQRQGGTEPTLVQPVWLRQIAIERGSATILQGAVYLSDLRAMTVAAPLDFVEVSIETGQPGNRLALAGDARLCLRLTNPGGEAAQGTVTLSIRDFYGAVKELASRTVALAPGETATVEVSYTPTALGAFTLRAGLLGTGVSRVVLKPIAVVAPPPPPDPSDRPDAPAGASLGTFGCHASLSGFREDQMDTVFALNRDAGMRWERATFSWQALEPSPGAFVWLPPPATAGVAGLAVRGPSGLATAPDKHLDLQDAITLAFWMRAEKRAGDWQWPVLKYADPPYRNYGVFLHKDTGVASFTAAFERGDRSPYFGVSSGWSPWDDQWHHFAATYSAESGTVILYVDGRECKREVIAGGRLRTGPEGLRLGSSYYGLLDEVVLCDRALAAEQIATLASRQDSAPEGLVARWSFDDAQNPGLDSGPHGLHATAARSDGLVTLSERARSHGMRVLGILGFPPAWASTAPADAARPWVYKPDLEAWAHAVEATTRHFAGLVDHWEIWNEPNISVFWEPKPNAKDFLDVVRVGYAAAKRGNPGCTVITPGLAGAGERDGGFLAELIAAGVVPCCDAISIHPYRQTTPEESDLVGDLTRIAALCEQNGGRRPLWITEWCWTTQIGGGSTEERSALMTARAIPLALGTGLVDRIIWFRLADPGVDRFYSEHNYGLCSNDLTPKPAYFAFRTCSRLLDGARPAGEIATAAGVWARQFQRDPASPPGAEVILAFWTPTGRAVVAVATDRRSLTVVDLMGNEHALPTRDGALFLDACEAVQFVRLEQPLATLTAPVDLRPPPRIASGEPAELHLILTNPLAKAVTVVVQLGEPLKQSLQATLDAHGSRDLPILFTAPPALRPGRHPLAMDVRFGDRTWNQEAALVVTSIRPGDALVGHWSFDEGKGTVAHDATANGLHGTITGCQWVPGRKGTALAFGGSSAVAVGGPAARAGVTDLVEVPDAPALNLPEEVTVAFWLKLTGDTGSWQFPVTKFRSNLVRNYGMYIRPSDFSAFFSASFVDAAAPHVDGGGGPALNDGQWHHLAATWALASGQMAVYVDGRKVGGLAVPAALLKTVAEPLRFGAGTKGVIDEVRIYGRALSAAEVQQLAREP